MDTKRMKKALFAAIPLLLKVLVIILMVVGVVETAAMGDGFMATAALLYFTIQSNITIAVICAVFLVFDIVGLIKKQKLTVPYWLYVLKFLFTVAITLTFLVYWCMLAPTMDASYLGTASNLCCHTFVPLFAIADWLIYDGEYRNKKYDFFWGTAMPLYYLAFAMICSACKVDFGGGSHVPYYFLNYEQLGWFTLGGNGIGVFWWIIIIVLIVLAIGWVLMLGKNKIYQLILRKEMKLDTNEVVTKEIDEKDDEK